MVVQSYDELYSLMFGNILNIPRHKVEV